MPVVPDQAGQVLVQRAAAGDVQHLQAAADAEQRQPAFERRRDERELGGVAGRAHAAGLRVRLRAERGRVDVPAARQDESVQPCRGLLDTGDGGSSTGRPPAAATRSA